MRRWSFISLIVVLLYVVQACHPEYMYEGFRGMNNGMDEGIPQKVLMFVGRSNDITQSSKGTGVIDEVDGLGGRNFNVYSFLKANLEATYASTNAEDPLSCLIDASQDDPSSIQGRQVYWNPESGLVEWVEKSADILFYPDGEALGLTYDFFAYYLDDMDVENSDFQRTKNSVVVDIEIDGSQDLMSSHAKPDETDLKLGLDQYDQEDAAEKYSHRKNCSFSWYTAELNIHPKFVFKHHLVRLDFKLVPGITAGVAKDVTVEKIEVCSLTKGKFTVAHKNPDNLGIDFYGNPVSLELKEKDGSEFQPRLITTLPTNGITSDGSINDLGSLLVAPDMEYLLYVTLAESRDGEIVSEGERNELQIYLGPTPGYDDGDENREDGGKFAAGGEYVITLTVYGKLDVVASTNLLKWDSGGDYTYDNDEEDWIN